MSVSNVTIETLSDLFLLLLTSLLIDLINAVGSIDSVMRIILKEFEYQSSLELEHDTYEAISHIPLATKIGIHA